MTASFRISDGFEKFADKLAKIGDQGERKLQQIVVETTLLAQEAIVDKITNDIEPHSGIHRKNNPQPVVTDLVDTGFYRSSWQPSFPGPFKGQVATNAVYALKLEYGDEETGQQPFYVARDTSAKMREVFKEKLLQGIKDLTK